MRAFIRAAGFIMAAALPTVIFFAITRPPKQDPTPPPEPDGGIPVSKQ